FAQSMLGLVDLFIAPSQFLRDRYVEWGIPADRIQFEENGCALPVPDLSADDSDRGLPNRLGFFGQLTRFKGVQVLLEGMGRLVADGTDSHLWLHGANFELQAPDYRKEITELMAAC